jgi:hypothetical protein
LSLRLQMAETSDAWNPPNGFDHVAFTVYFSLPGRSDGSQVLPLQHATMPDGLRWQYRLRVHGWSNAMFAANGAGDDREGTPVTPAADIRVDRPAKTIELRIPPAALGDVRSLSGLRIYVTTWDYDGGYRPLQSQPGPGAFGGGDGDSNPRVLDDIPVLGLP